MKKILLLAAVMMLTVTVQAFAGGASQAPTVGEAGYSLRGAEGTVADNSTLIGKMSKGVYTGWNTGTLGYAIITMHESGSQSYGTAHDSTSLYRIEGLQSAAPTASDSSSFDSWTKL